MRYTAQDGESRCSMRASSSASSFILKSNGANREITAQG
jgi:hypothetical protein